MEGRGRLAAAGGGAQQQMASLFERIQDRIAEIILGGGEEAVVHIDEFTPESFEKKLAAWPKPLIQF